MIPPQQVRSRNAAATRQAILDSARRAFAREAYDNVGLREIAGDAGVDPALVSRYFGGKEQLFKEAVRGEDQDLMLGVPRAGLAEHFADLLLEDEPGACGTSDEKTDRLLILLRSASSPRASQIIREAIDEDILRPVASALGGGDAELRASLCLALLMGIGILKSAMAVAPLCSEDRASLRARLVRLFHATLEDRSES
jgi:AcrR family transcriptional regulator